MPSDRNLQRLIPYFISSGIRTARVPLSGRDQTSRTRAGTMIDDYAPRDDDQRLVAHAIEGFVSAPTRRRLQRGVFRSIVDLQAAINR